MTRAVFFDVGGTLIRAWPSVGAVYARVGRNCGIEATDEAMEQAFRTAWRELRPGPLTTSDKQWWRTLVQRALASIGHEENEDYFIALYEAFAAADAWRVFPDVVPALHVVRKREWHVGAISNWDQRLRPLLERLALSQYFDSIIVSCEVGAEKPDPRIFRAALQAAGVRAEEAWHFGDAASEDVRGAEAAGIRGVLIDRNSVDGDRQLMTALRKIFGRDIPFPES